MSKSQYFGNGLFGEDQIDETKRYTEEQIAFALRQHESGTVASVDAPKAIAETASKCVTEAG